MADNTNQDNKSLEQDLIKLLQQRQGIGEGILDDARDLANVLRDQTKYVQFQVIEKNKLRSIGREIVKIADQNYAIDKKELGTQKNIADLIKQKQALKKNIIALSSLQNRIYTEDKELNREINESIQDQIKNTQQLLKETREIEKTSEKVANNFGVKTFGALSDISKAIPGLNRFSAPFEKAAEAAREAGVANIEQINLNKKLSDAAATKGQGLTREKIKQLGLESELGNLAGTAAAAKAKSLITENKAQNTFLAGAKALGPALTKAFGPLFLLVEVFKSFIELDKTIGDTAKQLGVSYNTAAGLSQQFNSIANSSGNIFITTKGINESFNQINGALGTNANLSEELLLTQTELTKQAFYSVEAATAISKLSLATGKPAKEITTEFLGQAKALNIINKTAINEKALVESIAKTSKGILITFAAQPAKLIEAAYQAKKLGINLEEIKGIQDSLLNIESSIAAEFEAEVLTGKQLNLERARYYALTNNISGLAQELGNQGIDQVKFAGMNVIQQDAIAKAMGMSRDQMAGMLMDQTIMSKLSQVDGATAKERYNNAVAKYGIEKANSMLGSKVLADQMASASMQDRFNASIEKLKELLVSIIEPLMPILDVFTNIFKIVGKLVQGVQYLSESLGGIGGILMGIIPLLLRGGFLMKSFAIFGFKGAIAAIFRTFAQIPLGLGIPLAAGAVMGLNQLFSSTPPGLAEGGEVTSGGTVMVGEKGRELLNLQPGATVTPLNKLNAATIATPQSQAFDYEKFGAVVVKAFAANPIQATTYFDVNEHARIYQKTAAGQNTHRGIG